MGLPSESIMDSTEVTVPYPAQTRQVAGEVAGIKTDVTLISFADKIMITITQDGRLAQWVRIYLYFYLFPVLNFVAGDSSSSQR